MVLRETVARNRVRDGLVYLQITRGVARRDHAFPPAGTAPSIVVTAKNYDLGKLELGAADGIPVISVPDNRWDRVDIKSVGLLPNVLAKQAAREAGAKEAWFVDAKGFVTEGSSTNAWIVTRDGAVVTRPADHGILRGITRTVVLDVIAEHGLKLEERPFTMDEAYAAREAFITSATQFVMPVVRIDGKPVGNGAPGLIASALRRDYHAHAEIACQRWTEGGKPVSPAQVGRQACLRALSVPSNGLPRPRAGFRPVRGRSDVKENARGEGSANKNGTTAMAAERAQNLQDTFLNHVRKSKTPLTIFLVNGVKLAGGRDLVR